MASYISSIITKYSAHLTILVEISALRDRQMPPTPLTGDYLPDTNNLINETGSNDITSPPLPHVISSPPSSSPSSTTSRAAQTALHRALNLASKKLLGTSQQHSHPHSYVTALVPPPPSSSSVNGEKIKEVDPLKSKKKSGILDPSRTTSMPAIDMTGLGPPSPSSSSIRSRCRFLILQILKDRDQQARICNLSGDGAQAIVDYLDIVRPKRHDSLP